MLVLTRKPNQSIMIRDDIEVTVLSVIGEKVRIGIDAPRHIRVFRKEIYPADDRHPHVTFATEVEIDLSRRDFTVNAMAIRVPEGDFRDWAAIRGWAQEIAAALCPADTLASPARA